MKTTKTIAVKAATVALGGVLVAVLGGLFAWAGGPVVGVVAGLVVAGSIVNQL